MARNLKSLILKCYDESTWKDFKYKPEEEKEVDKNYSEILQKIEEALPSEVAYQLKAKMDLQASAKTAFDSELHYVKGFKDGARMILDILFD